MRSLPVLLLLSLLLGTAAAEPSLHVQYPEDSYYDEDGTPLVPVAPGNAHSLTVRVTDDGDPVKNARVRFDNVVTGVVDTAWTNADGIVARGQYAGSDETWWDVDLSIECVMDPETGDCVDVAGEAQRVRVAWTRIQLTLDGPASAKTGGSATLTTTAVWTALGTPVPEGRVRVQGGGDDAQAYLVDGEAVTVHARDASGVVEFTATMDPEDRPAAVPVLASEPFSVSFRDDAPEQEPGEPTDEPAAAPQPSDDAASSDDADASEGSEGSEGSDGTSDPSDPSSGPGADPTTDGDADGEPTEDGSNAQESPAPRPLLILGVLAALALLRRRS